MTDTILNIFQMTNQKIRQQENGRDHMAVFMSVPIKFAELKICNVLSTN
jgi:hypothetical protein